jgi:hypothetical protein
LQCWELWHLKHDADGKHNLHLALQVDQVTPAHLQQHFVNFARNDNLGQISTWLLAQAAALGPASAQCQQLAALHSTAVDFQKTGKPADLDFTLVRCKNDGRSKDNGVPFTAGLITHWKLR